MWPLEVTPGKKIVLWSRAKAAPNHPIKIKHSKITVFLTLNRVEKLKKDFCVLATTTALENLDQQNGNNDRNNAAARQT